MNKSNIFEPIVSFAQKLGILKLSILVAIVLLFVAGMWMYQKNSHLAQVTPAPIESETTPSQEIEVEKIIESIQTPLPTAAKTIKPLFVYPEYGIDPTIQINTIHIISVLFIPKDITTPVKPEWMSNMGTINTNIKRLFEREFQGHMKISHTVLNQPTIGSLNIEEYVPDSIVLEVREKNAGQIRSGFHNVWMVYVVRDQDYAKNVAGGNLGGVPLLNASTQFEFWLDNEGASSYGLQGSAHEFGHALGIPHPWDLPANPNNDPNFGNVPGDLMGYQNNSVPFDKLYIRDDVKKKMGL